MRDAGRQFVFGILWRLVLVAALLTGLAGPGRADATRPSETAPLAGQFLVASPQMPDPRFAKTVIYMVSHDAQGAMGLVINRGWGTGSLRSLLQGIGIEAKAEGPDAAATVRLHAGGPVEQGRGFVLHSADYAGASTRVIGSGVALSAGPDVLQAMADGQGPRRRLILLGYAGWGPGQLEGELARDDWLTAPADAARVFSEDIDRLWEDIIRSAGTPL
jgi:putative transcriptional regulator